MILQMKLPGQMGQLDFGKWLYGLLSAFIGGGSGAFAAGLSVVAVDPEHLNPYSAKFWKIVTTTFFIGGIIPFFTFLHQEPLPELREVIRAHEEVSSGNKPVVVRDTVTERTVEPITTPGNPILKP